ncbi:DUF2971 domain-containing protein [Lacibacter luteus]|uniref:DUF2971 domain-containing protein n=1 Tax=Lacibacter luteus TaxID=2508719 RepID=A0A4Q1CET8_9BACT|nr:DUF2971 domain-containing protein [Lacibacter luteus]RXK58108.1 DUF2971 domain-containing protein [Lacibacter luteus]
MEHNKQQDILESMLDEYIAILDKYYPDVIDNIGYSGSNFHSRISRYFRHYKKTPFYFSGELKFVHWTSLNSLSSIVNNSEVRLYNLINSEDKEEFSYAGKLLSLSEPQISTIKDSYFTASFCSYENLNSKYLWKKYGKDYSGVAIVFSLIDNRDKWENFFLSKVYYKLDAKFENFQREIDDLKRKYNGHPTFMSDIWRFAGFFKKEQYEDEKEVRLSYIFPFKNEVEYLRYVRKELKIEIGRNRIVSYIPLKLWIDPNSSYLKTLDISERVNDTFSLTKPDLPQFKIEEIHFGNKCGLTPEEYYRFGRQLKEIFQWRLGYSIELPLNLYS